MGKVEADFQDKAGVKAVDMGPAWRKRALDLYWYALTKLSPQHIPNCASCSPNRPPPA
jgi:hypothetical protein